MSGAADEDTELRDLVAQSLEANGVLGKIRAQLRASVFLALEEQENIKNKTPLQNHELKKFMSTKEGLQVTGLVREFLQLFNLEYTLAVFDPETGCSDLCEGREGLARELNLSEAVHGQKNTSIPLITHLLHQRQQSHGDSFGVKERGAVTAILGPIDGEGKKGGVPANSAQSLSQKSFGSSSLEDENLKNANKHSSSLGDTKSATNHNTAKEDFKSSTKNGELAPGSKPINHSNSASFDQDDDSLFDDLLASSSSNKKKWSATPEPTAPANRSAATESTTSHKAGTDDKDRGKEPSSSSVPSNSMTSLAGLPALTRTAAVPTKSESDGAKKPLATVIKDMSIEDLDDDDAAKEDNYDEDFQTSCISPIGQTPRTARSDAADNSQTPRSYSNSSGKNKDDEDDEVEEDILEDISGEEQGNDDVTTDRTVSPTDQSAALDYLEDVLRP